MATRYVLEGFLDDRATEDDELPCWLVRPVVQYKPASNTFIGHLIEDVGIALTNGEELRNDIDLHREHFGYVRGAFHRARKAFRDGRNTDLLYFRVEILVNPDDEEIPFQLISYEGSELLRLTDNDI